MDQQSALKRLLHVLSERDIGLGRDDLGWLFESPETQHDMVKWVNEYLNHDTLLSPEELNLYYDFQGEDSNLESHSPSFRPLEELDFEASIKALESSTAAIDQQCVALNAQLEAMRQIQEHNALPLLTDDSSNLSKHPSQRHAARLYAETDQLDNSLRDRLTCLRRQTDGSLVSLKSSAQRQLDKDDRLLDGLQKLMSNLERPETNDQEIFQVEKLCQVLVALQSRAVKERANHTYVSAMQQANAAVDDGTSGPRPQTDIVMETSALAGELDSLIEEVDSVLEMVVDYQYRRPILDVLKQSQAKATTQQGQWLSYVQKALQQMTKRLNDLSSYTQDLHAYGTAIESASAELGSISAPQQITKAVQPDSTIRPTHKTIRDLVLPASTAVQHPALDLLRHHGIRIPVTDLESGKARASIEAAIEERKERLTGLSQSTERNITDQVSDSLNMADAQLQGLVQAVYAYSPYGTVNLADQDTKVRLAQLDKDIEGMGDHLRGLDLQKLIEREREQLEHVLRKQ